MKKIIYISFLFIASFTFAQKKDKIKGSKIITHTVKELQAVTHIEIEDNITIFLVKSDKFSLEIEADDNLHDVLNISILANTLRINTLKDVSGAKKFEIRLNYNDTLQEITLKHDAVLNALNQLELKNIVIRNFDNSKSFLNVKSEKFSIFMNDKSEAELNIKADTCAIQGSKYSILKALVAAPETTIDLYEKAKVTIEGDALNAKIRIDNNSNLIAKKFVVENINLSTENFAKSEVNASKTLLLSASGKSKTELYGNPAITIEKFTNTTILEKKEL